MSNLIYSDIFYETTLKIAQQAFSLELQPLTEEEQQAIAEYALRQSKIYEKLNFEDVNTKYITAKKNFCQACSNKKFGVKTRKSIPHTCNLIKKP